MTHKLTETTNTICFALLIVVESVRMAKEPEPRDIEQDENPAGSLSGFVSQRLREIADQKAEAEAQARTAKNKEMELFLQETALLRAHLQQLAGSMDRLLDRFRVQEVLEEGEKLFQNNRDKFPPSYSSGKVEKTEPPIYQDVVSHPNPTKLQSGVDVEYFIPSGRIPGREFYIQRHGGGYYYHSLKDLLNTDDFLRRIPSIVPTMGWGSETRGYGFRLVRGCYLNVGEQTKKSKYVPERYHWSVGGGSRLVSKGFIFEEWSNTGESIRVPGRRAINVKVVTSAERSSHALSFSVSKWGLEEPYRDVSNSNFKDILADEDPEILKQLVADQIVRELNSQ